MKLSELFPHQNQLVLTRYPTGRPFYSIWLGVSVILLHLPVSLWHHVCMPVAWGLRRVGIQMFAAIWGGLTGRVDIQSNFEKKDQS